MSPYRPLLAEDYPECPHGFPSRLLRSGMPFCPDCRRLAKAEARRREAKTKTPALTTDTAALAAGDHTLFGEDSP